VSGYVRAGVGLHMCGYPTCVWVVVCWGAGISLCAGGCGCILVGASICAFVLVYVGVCMYVQVCEGVGGCGWGVCKCVQLCAGLYIKCIYVCVHAHTTYNFFF